jgi:hypothetical protein
MAIISSNQPQEVTFTDSTGGIVTVTVNRAVQITSADLLIDYTSPDTSSVALLDLGSGALVPITTSPDNWANIYATAGSMFYEAGGTILAVTLSTGAERTLSAGASVYGPSGSPFQGENAPYNFLSQQSAPWDSDSWIYADSAGNGYALDKIRMGNIQAAAFPANGSTQVDFGIYTLPYFFASWLPVTTAGASNQWAGIDATTGKLYAILGRDEWDGDPANWGGLNITGAAVRVYQITMDPSTPAVMGFMPMPPAAAIRMNATFAATTHVGPDFSIQASVYTNGPETLVIAASSGSVGIEHYDTSAIPDENPWPGTAAVMNWRISGGTLYAGPTSASSTISRVDLTAGIATASTIVDAAGIMDWTISGGQVFYSTSGGTFQYDPVSTQTSLYSATPISVQGITN